MALEKVQVSLPTEALDYLVEQARLRGVSPAELISSALGTDKYLRDSVSSGADVVVRGKNGSVKVVLDKENAEAPPVRKFAA